VNILAERALNSVEQGLLNAPPSALGFKAPKSKSKTQQGNGDVPVLLPAERAKNEVEAGTHQLETLLCASIDRNFDKLEIYVLRNILTVRPPELRDWLRLSHYEGLDFSSSSLDAAEGAVVQKNDDTPTIESITKLRHRLRESMRLNALLTAERERNEALLGDLRRLVGDSAMSPRVKVEENASPARSGRNSAPKDDTNTNANTVEGTKSPFAFLHQKGDLASSGGGSAPLATTAAFTLSQMQALRALSTALSNVAPDLKNARSSSHHDEDEDEDGVGGDHKSWRRERVEYVEAATRRHLETVHGLELGRNGEVRDGEWQGPGRNLASGEVEGLERVVSLLGGGDAAAAVGPLSSSVPTEDEDEGERMDES
jgi:kinetochore protein Mis12/MTW1